MRLWSGREPRLLLDLVLVAVEKTYTKVTNQQICSRLVRLLHVDMRPKAEMKHG